MVEIFLVEPDPMLLLPRAPATPDPGPVTPVTQRHSLRLRGPDWTVALAMWQWSWPETRLTHCHIATVAGPLPAQYSLAELLYSYNSGRSCHCCIIAQSTITILTLLLQPNFPDYKEAIKYMLHQAIVHFIAQEAKMVPFFCLCTDMLLKQDQKFNRSDRQFPKF